MTNSGYLGTIIGYLGQPGIQPSSAKSELLLATCFVIQPFDGGKFDKRFDDILVPAIRDAGLEAYRVDRDPTVSIPIEQIESGIESCRACLADISTDNPNVWFELGYAIASQKEVVLICSRERTSKFPFDVQPRTIIRYTTESPRDFVTLQELISKRLQAMLSKETQLSSIKDMSPMSSIHGLEQYELATLIAVAQQSPDTNDGVTCHVLQQDMDKAGFTRIATTLGVRGLIAKRMLETLDGQDYYRSTTYTVYRVTPLGIDWLLQNTGQIKLQVERSSVLDDMPF